MEEIMAATMNNPEVLIIGVIVGFAAGKLSGRKRGMGGGF